VRLYASMNGEEIGKFMEENNWFWNNMW
jgi:hypothetical protein